MPRRNSSPLGEGTSHVVGTPSQQENAVVEGCRGTLWVEISYWCIIV